MKILASLLLGITSILVAGHSAAQIPTVALDSNCFFPVISHGDYDTIVGAYPGQWLGSHIVNLGPRAGGPGDIMIGAQGPFNDLSQPTESFVLAPTGRNFNPHLLLARPQRFLPDVKDLRFGHFRNRIALDIFDADNSIIYWADDEGNYDSNRATVLRTTVGEWSNVDISLPLSFTPYLSYLTSDTVEDLVLSATTFPPSKNDSVFLLLYRGGAQLASKSIQYEDTSCLLQPVVMNHTGYVCQKEDFRGVGRDDLLVADGDYNLFYFRNSEPFSLTELARQIREDTLWSGADNPSWRKDNHWWLAPNRGSRAMRALPKKTFDRSLDWIVSIPTVDDRDRGLFVFRGGPEFGSHRITIDSAAYVIRNPAKLGSGRGYYSWPEYIQNVGDMTGTGNNVLFVGASSGGSAYENYYVLGNALDDKIDVFDISDYAETGDTLTANADNKTDLLLGMPGYQTLEENQSGLEARGSLLLLHGSYKIPVRLNPQFADNRKAAISDDASIEFSPNPVSHASSVATITWPEAEEVTYEIRNLLGQFAEQGSFRTVAGSEQEQISFTNLPSGVYYFSAFGAHANTHTRLLVEK